MTASKSTPKSTRRKPKETVAINVALPVALHRKLRLKALHNELVLADAVAAAITDWVKR